MTLQEENVALKKKLELGKKYFAEMKKTVALSDIRAKATVKRNIRKTSDNLWVMENAIQDMLDKRKTSLTQMQNLLLYVQSCIENLKEAGVYMYPSE